MNNLINWSEVSRMLSGSAQNIRPNKIPKKYGYKIKILQALIETWVKLIKEN